MFHPGLSRTRQWGGGAANKVNLQEIQHVSIVCGVKARWCSVQPRAQLTKLLPTDSRTQFRFVFFPPFFLQSALLFQPYAAFFPILLIRVMCRFSKATQEQNVCYLSCNYTLWSPSNSYREHTVGWSWHDVNTSSLAAVGFRARLDTLDAICFFHCLLYAGIMCFCALPPFSLFFFVESWKIMLLM